jgi:hypothetical protein
VVLKGKRKRMLLDCVNPVKVHKAPTLISTGNGEEVKALNCSVVVMQAFITVYTQLVVMREVRNNVEKWNMM